MKVDVAIVGAGPVGLMLANLLQRADVSHYLIERREKREYWCKALGVTPRTLEVFDQMGILDEALDRGLFFQALNVVDEGRLVKRVEISQPKYPYGNFGLSQFDTEEVLEADLRRHGGRISRGVELVGLEQDASGVRLQLAGGETVEARYAVGCDGAHSLVRKLTGISFEGGRYAPNFMLGDVELDWDRPHAEVWRMTTERHGLCVVVPIAGNPRRYRVSMRAADGAQGTPALEELQERMPPEVRIRSLRWSSYYGISHRLAGQYRCGRVFLAGDAAHIHPPIGGLGMNTGLQDAHNLAWKLAQASDSLLESYHPERHKIGSEVVGLTAKRMDGEKLDPDSEERANTQLFLDYEGLGWCAGRVPEGHRGAAPGHRLDFVDGLERPHVQRRLRLIELLRHPGWTMIAYGGAVPLPGPAGCRSYVVGAEPPAGEEAPFILDRNGTWGNRPGLILVRPDGYVGWRGTPDQAGDLKEYLCKVS